MEPADAFDVESLLIWKTSRDQAGREHREVIGVRDFHIEKELLEGHKENLGVPVESNGEQVHIFDLCIDFGLWDTALALARHGVEGARVQPWHLGPYAEDRGRGDQCCCSDQTERCDFCTFGWEIDRGTWMEDWDASIPDAACAAREAVEENPFLREVMSCPDMIFEKCFSAEAMARLLDIAILTGDKEAAVCLSTRCHVWPLRRWRAEDLFECDNPITHGFQDNVVEVVLAVLAVGADVHKMQVPSLSLLFGKLAGNGPVPFPAAVCLSGQDGWHEIVRMCPPPSKKFTLRRLRCPNDLGCCFLEYDHHSPDGERILRLSRDKVGAAGKLCIDLRDFRCLTRFGANEGQTRAPSTLLGIAILCGQPDCAAECLRIGVDFTGWEEREDVNVELKRHMRDESSSPWKYQLSPCGRVFSPTPACRSAAKAAVRASWKREAAEKGVLMILLLEKIFGKQKAKSFPMLIVDDILFLSMKVPEFVKHLDLWDLVDGWMTTPAAGIQDEPEVRQEFGETCDPPASSDQPGTSSVAAGGDGFPDADVEDNAAVNLL